MNLSELLVVGRKGRVAVLTLNRPGSLNALNAALMRQLRDEVQVVAEDESVGCVVLTGAGRGFCAGGDTKAISKASKDRVANKAPTRSTTETRARWLRRNAEASRLLHEMPKPTIAMINGPCAGAGLSLAAACDFRMAAESATFRPAFTNTGMPGDYGGSWLWTQILGTARARQLYLVDESRGAQSALAFGLVNSVHADDQLNSDVMDLANRLGDLPASGLAYAKANLNAALNENFTESLDRESLNMILARNALVEKHKAEQMQVDSV